MLTTLLTAMLAAQAPQAATPAATAKPKKICREIEGRTGTHMRHRKTCKTEAEWRIEDEAQIPVTLQVKGEEVTRDRPQ